MNRTKKASSGHTSFRLDNCFTLCYFQQLEEELVEHEPQVDSLQEISSSLLIKGHREDYIEAEEKVHVIEKKLKQLREQVAQDLMSLQGSQVSPLVAFMCPDVVVEANRKAGCILLWQEDGARGKGTE
jgi:hypothetical protein